MQYIANITVVTGVPGNQIEIAPGSVVKGLDAEEIERLLAMGAVRQAAGTPAPADEPTEPEQPEQPEGDAKDAKPAGRRKR